MNSVYNNSSSTYKLIEKNEQKIKETKKIIVGVTLISLMIIFVLSVSLFSISERKDLLFFENNKLSNKNYNKSSNLSLNIKKAGNKDFVFQNRKVQFKLNFKKDYHG